MFKKIFLGGLLVFVVWNIVDFIMHSVLLQSAYVATANLWRPMNEMKMGLIWIVTLISAFSFSAIYALCINPKNVKQGLRFGALYGIAVGVGMGYGTYSVMPIPYYMALTWFLGTVVEGVLAGAVVGKLIKE